MKYLNKLALLSLVAVYGAQACFVTVVNDTQQAYTVHKTGDNSEAIVLEPGDETVFGNKSNKANFVVVEAEKRVRQEKCGMTDAEEAEKKDKTIHVSHILTGNLCDNLNDLFVIETNDEQNQEQSQPKKSSCGCKG